MADEIHLPSIAEMWAKWKIGKALGIKEPTYSDLPQSVRDDIESGDERKIKRGIAYTMEKGHGISLATREHINHIIGK